MGDDCCSIYRLRGIVVLSLLNLLLEVLLERQKALNRVDLALMRVGNRQHAPTTVP